MNLKDYLKKENISAIKFSKRLGVAESSVFRYLKGENATFKIAHRIQKLTNGEVTYEEMRNNSGRN